MDADANRYHNAPAAACKADVPVDVRAVAAGAWASVLHQQVLLEDCYVTYRLGLTHPVVTLNGPVAGAVAEARFPWPVLCWSWWLLSICTARGI